MDLLNTKRLLFSSRFFLTDFIFLITIKQLVFIRIREKNLFTEKICTSFFDTSKRHYELF